VWEGRSAMGVPIPIGAIVPNTICLISRKFLSNYERCWTGLPPNVVSPKVRFDVEMS